MQGLIKKVTVFGLLGFVFFASMALTGCGTFDKMAKKVLPKHVLLALIDVPDKLNLNDQGRSSPLFLYIFQLKKVDNFQQAQIFQLLDSPKGVLGDTLAGEKKLLLLPGKKYIHLKLKLKPKVTAIGVMAAYSNIINKKWRVTIPAKCDWGPVRVHVKFTNQGIELVND